METAHIQSKHVIEYGKAGFHNSERQGLYDLLRDKGCDVSCKDSDCYQDNWEMPADQFRASVEDIKAMDEEYIKTYLPNRTKEEVVDTLEGFIETGTDTDDYFHLDWF